MKALKYSRIHTKVNKMNQCPICKADLTNIWEHRHFKLMKGKEPELIFFWESESSNKLKSVEILK